MNIYSNIPLEMRQFKQWICWRAEEQTKVPYCPQTGQFASVSDPSSWTDFDSAVNASSFYSGVGFVFTQNDPFAGIDLDNKTNLSDEQVARQRLIFSEFDSYTEFSPSGKGLHIIVKGVVPHGRKRNDVEVYSTGRFFTMTGDVYRNKPVSEFADKLQLLWQQMGGTASNVIAIDQPQSQSDQETVQAALDAANGEKVRELAINGNWQLYYASQSEADFALIDIITFFTQNKEQIARIFRSSALGQRKKANRSDYIEWMINKAFDRQLAPIDIELNRDKITALLEQRSAQKLNGAVYVNGHDLEPTDNSPYVLPPGLVGEIAQFIYAASPRQVKEISLIAAIGLMAGICGRAYNVSGTGLNMYLLLLALTGTGKEGMANGIDKLMQAITSEGNAVPAATSFRGPADLMSGNALRRQLNDSTCFLSLIGEFGYRLQALSSEYASGADISLKSSLLDLYQKSGFTATAGKIAYAKKENDALAVQSPAVTLLGEATPSTFFKALSDKLIEDGLMPRFVIVEYNGDREYLNENHSQVFPSPTLVDKLQSLCAMCLSAAKGADGKRTVVEVQYALDAVAHIKQMDIETTDYIKGSKSEIKRQMYNRAQLNTLKLAALVAVGCNPIHPVITLEMFNWAKRIILYTTVRIIERFEQGLDKDGNQENKQFTDIYRIINDYFTAPASQVISYTGNSQMYYDGVIPYRWFNKRLSSMTSFKNDKFKASVAIKSCLKAMCDMGTLSELQPHNVDKKYKTKSFAYIVDKDELKRLISR